MSKTAVTLSNAPKPAGPYSQGIVANGFLYTAGFGPADPSTGLVVEGGVAEQTARSCATSRPSSRSAASPSPTS